MDTIEMPPKHDDTATQGPARPFRNRRFKFLGLDGDQMMKGFFGGNATVAIIVLALITIFLIKEGVGFFGQERKQLEMYRSSGLEYVDKMRQEVDSFYALTRYLTHIKTEQMRALEAQKHEDWEAASADLKDFQGYLDNFRDQVVPLQSLVDELSEKAEKLRNDYASNLNNIATRKKLEGEAAAAKAAGNLDLAKQKADAAAAVGVKDISFPERRKPLMEALPEYTKLSQELRNKLMALAQHVPSLPTHATAGQVAKFRQLVGEYGTELETTDHALHAWDPDAPIPFGAQVTNFFFGTRWVTNSFFQDWYGLVPLLTGSLLVSFIALAIGVPLGVAAAIYVNQIAGAREARIIKPYIEFVSAIPSVVIGFFGVLVWGEFVRTASHWAILSWIPGLPIAERLNAFTAGCLLALMAIPTIFTLAEDALNAVPRSFKEASFAVGATRLQTAARVVVPTALSGIISAILLGFGRVIGETMVVLLCAGNRISIPNPGHGLGMFFEPVHTMTGIVAQEMGEVVPGSIHYRALFLVGTTLFFISLLINYLAQKIVRRFRIAAA